MNIRLYLLLLFIVALLPLISLLHPGLPITHDGQDHVARIANFYQNLQEGNIIPRWAGNLNWGYGHPVLMFLYPLPSYIGSVIHFLGFSFVDSTKLVFALSFVTSILTMYLWLRTFLSEKAALLGAFLYGYAPYHFVDLYVRGAIGELVAFVFAPLVLYFLLKLSKKNNYWYLVGGSLSLAGFILAHNAISLMFLPILFFYVGYLWFTGENKKNFIRNTLCVILAGFALSAFFWLPALLEGKYTLRDIVTAKEYQNRFVSLTQLFYGPWNYGQTGEFTVQIGVLHWLFIFIAISVLGIFYKTKNKLLILVVGFLVIFFLSLFLTTQFARPIWNEVTLLQKFQFPWRLLFLTMFTSSTIGAIIFNSVQKKSQLAAFIFFVTFLLMTTYQMWQPKSYLLKPEQFYTEVYNGTTDTGESSPIWSVRFMESRPKAPIEIISGAGKIELREKTTTMHQYKLTLSQKSQLKENTLYFPGWHVFIDGKPTFIEFQDTHNRGLITFWVDAGQHNVKILFEDTKLRTIADGISVISLFLIVILSILRKRIWQD